MYFPVFFQMVLAMNPEIVELLAGHSGYLSDAYRRYPKDQVQKEYLRGEYEVSLSAPDVAVKAELENQKAVVQSVVSENLRMKQEMDAMKQKIEQISLTSDQIDSALTELPDDVKQIIANRVIEKIRTK